MSTRVTTAAVMAFGLSVLPTALSRASDAPLSVTVSFAESSQSHAAIPPVTAVGLRHAGATDATEPAATDVLVLFDTSASQAGPFRAQAEEVLHGILAQGRAGDRFCLAAVDVNCSPLADGFVDLSADAIQEALLALSERTPLGATDMAGAVAQAVDLFGNHLGRGRSSMLAMDPESPASNRRFCVMSPICFAPGRPLFRRSASGRR